MAAKKKSKKTKRVKRTKRSKTTMPKIATPDMGRMMETAMSGVVAVTGIGAMTGIAGAALGAIPKPP